MMTYSWASSSRTEIILQLKDRPTSGGIGGYRIPDSVLSHRSWMKQTGNITCWHWHSWWKLNTHLRLTQTVVGTQRKNCSHRHWLQTHLVFQYQWPGLARILKIKTIHQTQNQYPCHSCLWLDKQRFSRPTETSSVRILSLHKFHRCIVLQRR